MTIPAPHAGVQVRWMVPLADGDPRGEWLDSLLDASELERARRFRFVADRAAYVAAHALLRGLLSARLTRPASALRFTAALGARPVLVGEAAGARLRFSLSRARGMVVVALGEADAVGVDVEKLARCAAGGADEGIPDSALAAFERDRLGALAGDARLEAGMALWTLKEAYLKATGLGLASPPAAVGFTLAPLSVRFAAPLDDDPARWAFRRWRIDGTHVAALAVRGGAPVDVEACALSVDDLRRMVDGA